MKFLRAILILAAGLCFALTLLAGLGAVSAWMDRAQHGPGLMFAAAELLTMLTLLLGVLGGVLLLGVRALSRRIARGNAQPARRQEPPSPA